LIWINENSRDISDTGAKLEKTDLQMRTSNPIWIPASIALLISCVSGQAAESAAPDAAVVELPALSVIAHAGARPLTVELNPKAPAQPIPAQDGAEVLRAIPGFNVIRKGGTDGDPVLRGMAGSRLGIQIDGETVLGGCGMRMDPPTAYVFPSAHDRVTLLKGPQSVRYGPGNSAGVVRFERIPRQFATPGWEGNAALTMGAFDRIDGSLDLRGGNSAGQFQLVGTWSEAGDYKDGGGRAIASAYQRWSLQGALGWTPGDDMLVELTGVLSDAEAAYADRAMDGVVFERENVGLRLRRVRPGEWLREIEAKWFYNYIDHVMDNFSLRPFTPGMMMPDPAVSNPDRETLGGWVHLTLAPGDNLEAVGGIDYQFNRHTLRKTRNESVNPHATLPRLKDAEFENFGLFGEATWRIGADTRLVGGLRVDFATADDARREIAVGMAAQPNPTAGDSRRETLPGGFVRLERDFGEELTVYAGVGHTRRFPDYWELFNKESRDSLSAFHTPVERTTQLDVGFNHRIGAAMVSVSLFASDIRDYVLIENAVVKPGMGGSRMATVSRSIDARTWGGEATVSYRIADDWLADLSLAYVRGENRSDDRPLAQQPPLEGRFSLRYERDRWSVGGLWRMVDAQDRFALNQGNIVGQDLGPTPGFGVLSLNASWRPARWNRVTVGVDNLFDKAYAEHLSRAGAQVAGFPPPTTRVNEPGRTWWIAWSARY
jgi:iron complex outermembrane receptor protein